MASFTDLSQLLHSEATNFSAYPRTTAAKESDVPRLDSSSDDGIVTESGYNDVPPLVRTDNISLDTPIKR